MSSFDLTAIMDMADGNEEFVKEFIATFLENTTETLGKLMISWEKRDMEQVFFLAHKLKPAIDLARVNALKEEIRFVEINARDGVIEGLEERILKIKQVLERVFEEMREEF